MLALFFLLLVLLPILTVTAGRKDIAVFDSFYRSGSLVFGGGHVILPLLRAEVVPNGWVADDAFLAGYGAAQALPGPLFTSAAYLGTVIHCGPYAWVGGTVRAATNTEHPQQRSKTQPWPRAAQPETTGHRVCWTAERRDDNPGVAQIACHRARSGSCPSMDFA